MRPGRRFSSLAWIPGAGLVFALCAFAPQRNAQEGTRTKESAGFIGARVQCAGTTEAFTHGLRPSIVPFSSTAFEVGGFTLADGRIKVPKDGRYIVEAGVSIRFRGSFGPISPGIRMSIRSTSGVIAGTTGQQVREEGRTTCLSTSTMCELKMGDEVSVELSAEALHDEGKDYPLITGENGEDVCHLSIALLGQGRSGRR